MNKKIRVAGLILALGLLIGTGFWQRHGEAAGRQGNGPEPPPGRMAASAPQGSATGQAPAAVASTIPVTSTGDGTANAAHCPGPNCRLRDAIAKAVAGDTINFSVTGTITLNSGELFINKNLTINGPGAAQLTISGNHASRVFNISGGFAIALSGLTIANGNCGLDDGGGIYNAGTLTITNSTISGTSANRANSVGGGILNQGTLIVTKSTVSGNSARRGGGIGNGDAANLINCTISGNSASAFGGGIFSFGPLNARNTIVAGNTAFNRPDVSGLFISQGYNLIGNDDSQVITPTTGDQIGTPAAPINPLLGALDNNGGPTQTRALLPGSPAIDAGQPRLIPRPVRP